MNFLRKWVATLLTLAFALTAFAMASAPATAAVAATSGEQNCSYEWNRSIPQSHPEWRFRTRVPLYGEKEVKDVKGYDFVAGGVTVVNGVTIPGHWQQSPGWHTIPDVVINAVWGPGGVPDSVLGEGQVNLRVYGGPNVVVRYDAYKVQTDEGYTEWSAWSDWSTTDPGPETDTRDVETHTVQDESIVQGPIRSVDEPDRGQYPDVPWVQDGGTKECPPTEAVATAPSGVDKCEPIKGTLDTFTVPNDIAFQYSINDGLVAPGKYPATTKRIVLTAIAKPDFTPKPGSQTVFELLYDKSDDCFKPVKVHAAVKKNDKCRTAGDVFGARSERGVVYTVKGKVIREGVWISTRSAHRVVVKAKAASERFNLVGKDKWVLKFTNKSCGDTPDNPPPAGE